MVIEMVSWGQHHLWAILGNIIEVFLLQIQSLVKGLALHSKCTVTMVNEPLLYSKYCTGSSVVNQPLVFRERCIVFSKETVVYVFILDYTYSTSTYKQSQP